MTIPEADAVSTLLRYLAPGSTVPAEELRAAATRLRCEHTHSAAPPHSIWAPSPCEKCGMPHGNASQDVPERLREPLAAWLEDAARTAGDHQQMPDYAGLPDHRWCLGCQDEECDGLRATDKALAVARVINGAAEQPGGEPAPAEQPVAAATLRPDMVVSHPTWLNGDPVRIVTARVGAGVVSIRYRDVRAHHADVQVEVPPNFEVTPGAGFEPRITPTPSRELT